MGIDALASKPRTGRPRKIKLQRLRDLLVPVLENPTQAQQLHWTGVKVHGWLKEQLCVELGYRTVIRYLHELDYHLRVPQRWPERQQESERAAFLEQLALLRADPRVELWYGDECGVEGDPRPRRRWSARGSRPRVPYFGDHIRANVLGAVCPHSGQSFAMIFDGVDTDVFQCFLDHLAETIPPDKDKRVSPSSSITRAAQSAATQRHHLNCKYSLASARIVIQATTLLRLKADYSANSRQTPEHYRRLCSPSRFMTTLKVAPLRSPEINSHCSRANPLIQYAVQLSVGASS